MSCQLTKFHLIVVCKKNANIINVGIFIYVKCYDFYYKESFTVAVSSVAVGTAAGAV